MPSPCAMALAMAEPTLCPPRTSPENDGRRPRNNLRAECKLNPYQPVPVSVPVPVPCIAERRRIGKARSSSSIARVPTQTCPFKLQLGNTQGLAGHWVQREVYCTGRVHQMEKGQPNAPSDAVPNQPAPDELRVAWYQHRHRAQRQRQRQRREEKRRESLWPRELSSARGSQDVYCM